MKIAILAPSSVPYERGGAENLFETLQAWINENTPHDCELLKVPSRERSFFDLLRTYKAFMSLDLSHFDLVIATKYPSWMVQHDNLVVYMLHPLRGLYDTYHFTGFPIDVPSPPAFVQPALDLLEQASRSAAITQDQATQLIDAFAALEPEHGEHNIFAFPAPLIRKLVHFLDRVGMQPSRVQRYLAIAQTVAERENYFPAGIEVDIRYPPSFNDTFISGGQKHIFTASRLDGAKRIGLLVQAMRASTCQLPLLIAGDGPEREEIMALAGDDPRIRFLGRISNDQMLDYYSESLFVPFVPYDEDYGLITIEAMLSGKPVLTCTDSGGTNEFVEHGINGLSVAPDIDALSAAIEQLSADPDATKAMGQRAASTVSNISWANVVEGLLGEHVAARQTIMPAPSEPPLLNFGVKPHLLVTTTFPIYPPQGGGQQRIFNIYSRLANIFDVDLVTFAPRGAKSSQKEIAPGLVETSIPPSRAHQAAEEELAASINHAMPISDIATINLWRKTPRFVEAVRTLGRGVFAAVNSHPYLASMLRETLSDAAMWTESHNTEFRMKRALLPQSRNGELLAQSVFDVERVSWQQATRIMACSEDDLVHLEESYGACTADKHFVPNGVSLKDVQFISHTERQDLKTRIGLEDRKIALFMGSWHPPNLQAMEDIISLAPHLPDITFHLVGGGCNAFNGRKVPSNVRLFGLVSEEEKVWLLSTADLALNPMLAGSGTNLKMFDYMASGLPVLATEFGARGLRDPEGISCIVSPIETFAQSVRDTISDRDLLCALGVRARKHVAQHFDWDIIVGQYVQDIGFSDAASG